MEMSRIVSRPLSVSDACLGLYCDKGTRVQLNWSSILLDGYKSVVYRGSLRMSVKTIDSTVRLHRQDTVKGYKYRFLFIFFLTACFTSVLVFYNQVLLCVSCCLLACVFDSVLFLGLLIYYRLICYLF